MTANDGRAWQALLLSKPTNPPALIDDPLNGDRLWPSELKVIRTVHEWVVTGRQLDGEPIFATGSFPYSTT